MGYWLYSGLYAWIDENRLAIIYIYGTDGTKSRKSQKTTNCLIWDTGPIWVNYDISPT